MNKTELIAIIAKESGISKVQASVVVKSITEIIKKALKNGDRITIIGFGTFYVEKRIAKSGRYLQSGEKTKSGFKAAAKFSADKILSAKIDKGGSDHTGPRRVKC